MASMQRGNREQNQKVIENICLEPYNSYGLTLQESPSLIGNNDDVPEDATARAGENCCHKVKLMQWQKHHQWLMLECYLYIQCAPCL